MPVPYVMVLLNGPQGEDLLQDPSNVQGLLMQVYTTFGAVSLSLIFVGLNRHLIAKERSDHRNAASGMCAISVALKSCGQDV